MGNFSIDSSIRIDVANPEKDAVDIYSSSEVYLTPITSNNSISPLNVFVHPRGEIYIDYIDSVDRVHRSGEGSFTVQSSFDVDESCWALFVDRNGSLYCSASEEHRVLIFSAERWSFSGKETSRDCGSASTELCWPTGMYVDDNFDLYVADMWNNRIQRFEHQSVNGTTILGGSGSIVVSLSSPIDVTMDATGTLLVADNGNRRIIQYF